MSDEQKPNATQETPTQDAPEQGAPKPDPQEKPPERQSGEAPSAGRVFTESEVNAMIAGRLSSQEKAIRRKISEEQKEAERQAEMTATERAREIEAKAAKEIEALQQKLADAERLSMLAGKVTNPKRVLRLMDDPEHYFKNGSLDEKALAADFPEYLPRSTAPQPENRPHRPGGTIDDMIRSRARGGSR